MSSSCSRMHEAAPGDWWVEARRRDGAARAGRAGRPPPGPSRSTRAPTRGGRRVPVGSLARRAAHPHAPRLVSMAVVFPLFLLVPLVAPPRPFEPADLLGWLVALERDWDTPACAFPLLPRRAGLPGGRRALGALPPPSPLGLGGGPVLPARRRPFAHRRRGGTPRRRRAPERPGLLGGAPSWRGARGQLLARLAGRPGPPHQPRPLGRARRGAGVVVLGSVLGPGSAALAATTWFLGVVGAGAWAQAVEGRGLSRPFGFYGGLLGVVAGVLLAPAFGFDRWTALAAGAMAAPVVQALGRMRCLVQGCCHGAPAPEGVGIRHLDAPVTGGESRPGGRAGAPDRALLDPLERPHRGGPPPASRCSGRPPTWSRASTSSSGAPGASSRSRTGASRRPRSSSACGSTSGWRSARPWPARR